MPSAKNVAQLQTVQEKVKKAKSVVFTNYAGLTVAEQTKLRADIKAVGGEFLVAKNTLLNKIFGKPELTSTLQGQTGVVLSYDDEIAGIKSVVEFTKKAEKPELKLGWMANKMLSLDDIKALAKLPGKAELMATLVSRLKGPSYGLVNVLQGGIRNLVYALHAIEKKTK